MAEKWILRTSSGEIDVSHLTPEQRAQAQTDLFMIDFFRRQALVQVKRNLTTPLLKRNRK